MVTQNRTLVILFWMNLVWKWTRRKRIWQKLMVTRWMTWKKTGTERKNILKTEDVDIKPDRKWLKTLNARKMVKTITKVDNAETTSVNTSGSRGPGAQAPPLASRFAIGKHGKLPERGRWGGDASQLGGGQRDPCHRLMHQVPPQQSIVNWKKWSAGSFSHFANKI